MCDQKTVMTIYTNALKHIPMSVKRIELCLSRPLVNEKYFSIAKPRSVVDVK
jgi:hypothetical protein